jgi:hypothetical protein
MRPLSLFVFQGAAATPAEWALECSYGLDRRVRVTTKIPFASNISFSTPSSPISSASRASAATTRSCPRAAQPLHARIRLVDVDLEAGSPEERAVIGKRWEVAARALLPSQFVSTSRAPGVSSRGNAQS